MPRIKGTTDSQSKFLRLFRTSPFGPGLEGWPSPAILRRWLRKPGFVRAMRGLKIAMIYQSDFQLLSVAASASHALHTNMAGGSDDEAQTKQMQLLTTLLKLAHARQRFTTPEPKPQPPFDPIKQFELIHPELTVGEAISLFRTIMGKHAEREPSQEELFR